MNDVLGIKLKKEYLFHISRFMTGFAEYSFEGNVGGLKSDKMIIRSCITLLICLVFSFTGVNAQSGMYFSLQKKIIKACVRNSEFTVFQF